MYTQGSNANGSKDALARQQQHEEIDDMQYFYTKDCEVQCMK
jgi:hypothetical protein